MEGLIEGLVIEVEHRSIYGNDRMYPKNRFAEVMCELLGQTTLTDRDVKVLHKIAAVHSSFKRG